MRHVQRNRESRSGHWALSFHQQQCLNVRLATDYGTAVLFLCFNSPCHPHYPFPSSGVTRPVPPLSQSILQYYCQFVLLCCCILFCKPMFWVSTSALCACLFLLITLCFIVKLCFLSCALGSISNLILTFQPCSSLNKKKPLSLLCGFSGLQTVVLYSG